MQSVKQALGPDKLSFCAIQLLWKWDQERMVRMTTAAICTGRHAAVWMQSSGIVIPKPGTDNYTELNVYRPKSLLSCMGTVVEKVATELLSERAD